MNVVWYLDAQSNTRVTSQISTSWNFQGFDLFVRVRVWVAEGVY